MADPSASLNPRVLRLKLAASLVLAITLLSTDFRYALSAQTYPAAGLLIQPIVSIVHTPLQFAGWVGQHFQDLGELIKQNRNLYRQLRRTSSQLQRLGGLEKENQRLRALLELEPHLHSERSLIAELIQVNTGALRHQIVINRGRLDDVYIGQPVLDPDGIVGQVSRVGLSQAIVLLITDPSHAVLVHNQRTGDRYLAHGNNNNLMLRHVPRYNDLRIGDIMVTSGLDQVYPAQYRIGQIKEILPLGGYEHLEASVEVSAHLHRNHEVLLLWPPPKSETDEEPLDE